ncbi:MAG: ribosome maturation factor RimP [Cellvibrionaceae bacterium]|nr:ribosome maturation factor RimP [Cellvibrionaceae bacterium]
MLGKISQLEQLFSPAISSLGCELWGIDFRPQGKNSLLRIYIEKQPGGVQVEDCEKVSRQISSILDVEDPISGEYTLEVSSPGLDRPLYKLAHFAAYAGNQVELRLRVSFENRRNFKGLLKGIEQDEVILEVDGEEYLLPYELIEKAKVVPTFS